MHPSEDRRGAGSPPMKLGRYGDSCPLGCLKTGRLLLCVQKLIPGSVSWIFGAEQKVVSFAPSARWSASSLEADS